MVLVLEFFHFAFFAIVQEEGGVMVTTAKDTPTTITLRFEELDSTILTNNPQSCLDSLSRPAVIVRAHAFLSQYNHPHVNRRHQKYHHVVLLLPACNLDVTRQKTPLNSRQSCIRYLLKYTDTHHGTRP